jgi:hypothetical protein
MRRIAYRKILPATQLAVYVLLIWYGCPYRRTWQSWSATRPDAVENWNLEWIDGPPNFEEQLALGLNSPALLSTLLLIPFDAHLRTGAAKELASYSVMALFVPFLWYVVGRRLDRRGGTAAPRPSMIRRVLIIAGLLVSAVVAVLMVVALVVRLGEGLTARVLILAWASWGILLCFRAIRHWRTGAAA